MRQTLFNYVARLVPKISETELVALRTGNTSLDRMIYQGKVVLPSQKANNNDQKNKIWNQKVDKLLQQFPTKKVYPNPNWKKITDYLGHNKFFSFIIDEKYEGSNLSVKDISSILVKISSKNPAIGVTVMVPNSLGPGELLQEYGTEEQKQKFLPGLSQGKYIPCFGLTGPDNGSDAAGKIDRGIVRKNGNRRYIEVEINKRYITLAPISNLVGVAFKLEDPDNLLESGEEGITVALLEGSHPGLKKETYHNPLDAGFPNGTLKGNFEIELDQIIGGEEMVGQGWKMLMECLAAGRAICLPGTALASAKVSTWGTWQYAKHRKQFNIPLQKMEGVNEKLLDMVYETWLIQSSVHLTNFLLDSGDKPAVISALMKQQTTERARTVIENGMDILGGSAICSGPNNFLDKFYRSAPIGITVEGSNTLTRSLIIFGQGLNKSHPHIFSLLDSVMKDDINLFYTNLRQMLGHSFNLYFKTWIPFQSELEKQTVQFANLSNFLAFKGGSLKKEQYISGDMADIFSNLYLAYSVKWYHEQNGVSELLTKYCIQRLLAENKNKFGNILANEKLIGGLLLGYPRYSRGESYETRRMLLEEIRNNEKIMSDIKNGIYIDKMLTSLGKLDELDINSEEYQKLYQQVISVGEYRNI